MFRISNLIFVSMHENIVGSIYFRIRRQENDGSQSVYRGRIRLRHSHGPEIVWNDMPETFWQLAKEREYIKMPGKLPAEYVYGDIVTDEKSTIDAAEEKIINEKYSHGIHPSRGILVKPGSLCESITQQNIDSIISTIERYNVPGTETTRITTTGRIDEANAAIISLLSNHPALRQE